MASLRSDLPSAILPGMSRKVTLKPRIAIVGAGNLAGALAISLHEAEYVIAQIISRGRRASVRRARKLAREVGASVVATGATRRIGGSNKSDRRGAGAIDAGVVWFCVPDGAIARAARSLADAADWKGKVALHSSGALTSDQLDVLRRRGAAVASVHPLMTFVRDSRPGLGGVPFAIEGERKAVRAARAIVQDMGGEIWPIHVDDKDAYHAWGTFASPLLTALLATSEQVAACAGVKAKAARRRMLPMLKQTLANYEAYGAAGAFSGPIVRGDLDTVQRHLRLLRRLPVAKEVYVALARAALAYLPAKNKKMLAEWLGSVRQNRGGR
jgi:predicted short-subunit dehydrogenase-like oxidoreductase (DUF2520 family)